MEASTFKLKTPHITGGRSHIPLSGNGTYVRGAELLYAWTQK